MAGRQKRRSQVLLYLGQVLMYMRYYSTIVHSKGYNLGNDTSRPEHVPAGPTNHQVAVGPRPINDKCLRLPCQLQLPESVVVTTGLAKHSLARPDSLVRRQTDTTTLAAWPPGRPRTQLLVFGVRAPRLSPCLFSPPRPWSFCCFFFCCCCCWLPCRPPLFSRPWLLGRPARGRLRRTCPSGILCPAFQVHIKILASWLRCLCVVSAPAWSLPQTVPLGWLIDAFGYFLLMFALY